MKKVRLADEILDMINEMSIEVDLEKDDGNYTGDFEYKGLKFKISINLLSPIGREKIYMGEFTDDEGGYLLTDKFKELKVNPIVIVRTVKDSFLEVYKKENLNLFFFKGRLGENSRISLYDKMSKMASKSLGIKHYSDSSVKTKQGLYKLYCIYNNEVLSENEIKVIYEKVAKFI
ncbi:MAG: hypothetical protein H8D23_00555 [Candidatus Brocadiales bacterium]|nr:hypothetical protein [Candidatus Brocadiales bacterium]